MTTTKKRIGLKREVSAWKLAKRGALQQVALRAALGPQAALQVLRAVDHRVVLRASQVKNASFGAMTLATAFFPSNCREQAELRHPEAWHQEAWRHPVERRGLAG